ncbi:hypothetical protein IMZ48_46845, partial [Candidatus Bathyarchaeota archaeon]|nr:hypothetical protein [Candidatus Bathyarchaeota archaeon]
LLATRRREPTIWHIDPNEKTKTVLVDIKGAGFTRGITEVSNELYVFFVGSASAVSTIENPTDVPGVPGIWKVDLSGGHDQKPVAEPVAAVPDIKEGQVKLPRWDDTRVLMSDRMASKVYIVDLHTGESEIAFYKPEADEVIDISA